VQDKISRKNLVMFAIAGSVILLDQWTKSLVRAHLPVHESWMPVAWLEPYVTLTHTHNTGVAFGLFQGRGVLFSIVNIVVVAAIILAYRHIPSESWLLRIALGLEMGGAIGNLIDRLTIGHVTDFINVRVFAVFNVADSCITVGALLLGYYALFLDRDEPAHAASRAAPLAPPDDAGQEPR
jgi:signal peptidase II